ncbi:MAG: hypothetical protein EXS36_19970 [Pedosphaera sp.]|nr:hypothetical protein [Pedosphaera sp.]
MKLFDYLRPMGEQVPPWLADFPNGGRFERDQFFGSRIVFYPGSGTDGQPVRLFGSTHSAHCFVYADYGVDRPTVEAELEHLGRRFRGYHTLARVNLTERDLSPRVWTPHTNPAEVDREKYRFAAAPTFGFLEVLERDQGFDDSHGARKLAILFLGADGFAAYDGLFCQEFSVSAPIAVVVQDHGFGGNYDRFGRGGWLERIASRCDVVPRWLLVAQNTDPWEGFVPVPGVDGDPGGMHATPRFLHERRNMSGLLTKRRTARPSQ